MSEHTHTTLIEGCYRCDLNRDEIRDALADAAEPKCAHADIHETPSSMVENILRTNHVCTAEPDATVQVEVCSECQGTGFVWGNGLCLKCKGERISSTAEPKCAECGHEAKDHDNGKDCLWDTVEKAGGPLVVCKCQRYRVSEPDDNFKIEPISQHTLKVPVQYKGQAEPLDFTEPDATERARAWVQKQTGRFELDNPLLEADIADLAAFLESEAPRIRADERKKAVREFVTRFKKNVGYLSHPVNVKLMIDRTVKEMMVEQMIKEMTEVD